MLIKKCVLTLVLYQSSQPVYIAVGMMGCQVHYFCLVPAIEPGLMLGSKHRGRVGKHHQDLKDHQKWKCTCRQIVWQLRKSKKYSELGIRNQRCVFVKTLAIIPWGVKWIFGVHIYLSYPVFICCLKSLTDGL